MIAVIKVKSTVAALMADICSLSAAVMPPFWSHRNGAVDLRSGLGLGLCLQGQVWNWVVGVQLGL